MRRLTWNPCKKAEKKNKELEQLIKEPFYRVRLEYSSHPSSQSSEEIVMAVPKRLIDGHKFSDLMETLFSIYDYGKIVEDNVMLDAIFDE